MNTTQNKKVRIELERIIKEFGIDKSLDHISLIICAQQNELEKMVTIIDECADSITEISKALAKSMKILTQYFDIENEEETEGTKQ